MNTKVVVQNLHSAIPSSTNIHITQCNACNKSAQKLKSSSGKSESQSPIVTCSGHTVNGSFTHSDCDCKSKFAKNGSIVFQYYYLHLVKVNIKGKVSSQSQSQMQSLSVNRP